MKRITLLSIGLAMLNNTCFSQKSDDRTFGDPILTDSASTVFIPVYYDEPFFSSNKLAVWGNYYSNIIVYNYVADTYNSLFQKDVLIQSFRSMDYYPYWQNPEQKPKNFVAKRIIMLVKEVDTDGNKKIDNDDPSMLYVSLPDGSGLKQMTFQTEHVESFQAFEKQGFVLMKIQKDSNNDGSFDGDDQKYYYRKLNLADLQLGNPILLPTGGGS